MLVEFDLDMFRIHCTDLVFTSFTCTSYNSHNAQRTMRIHSENQNGNKSERLHSLCQMCLSLNGKLIGLGTNTK